ncbi:MAG: hypothetical protein EAY75_07340 [Bacteroidetes bacterium]|nr:MAG: hypothetical protein EAY75_07340 [Bacteroidota bacterium]
MPNRQKDDLFQLIKSLGKGEKRNLKLYVQRNSGNTELKVLQLFDALDHLDEYDEGLLLRKQTTITKQQLSNLKASLYRHILTSLRLLKDDDNVEQALNEQMDYARILYHKGLYLQSLKLLERLKLMARHYHQLTHLLQVLFFEKKIETLYITRSMDARADQLADESGEVLARLNTVNALSNLSLQLYSWYIKNGHARNAADEQAIATYFKNHLPSCLQTQPPQGFYERLYFFQSHCWLAFINQDYLNYYRYAQRWVSLFDDEPHMKLVENIQYIKGMHNLLGAHYDLKNAKQFFNTLATFETFWQSTAVQQNDNYRIQAFVYLYTSKIHRHFLEGTFTEGLNLLPELEGLLKMNALYIDEHRVLVFYYKIACLYFGSGRNGNAIDYLNRIINHKSDLRTDLQCYARLLHLIAHYELGNYDLLSYLIKSVYRFMAKLQNLSLVEEAMFAFLRAAFSLNTSQIKPRLEGLLERLKQLESTTSETRAFAYLDVISWLESKIAGVAVEQVIRNKYLLGKRRPSAQPAP